MFVSLEGIDGSGKSTMLSHLEPYLKSKALDIVCTREPSGTDLGCAIRDMVLTNKDFNLNDTTILLLMLAARSEHIQKVIKPALAQGKVVITDRFFDSTIVYQGVASKLPIEMVSKLVNATCDITPDLTILLEIDPLTAMKRRFADTGSLDNMEQRGESFYNSIAKGYSTLARNNPVRIKTVKADQEPHLVFSHILKAFNNALNFKRGKRIDDSIGVDTLSDEKIKNILSGGHIYDK